MTPDPHDFVELQQRVRDTEAALRETQAANLAL